MLPSMSWKFPIRLTSCSAMNAMASRSSFRAATVAAAANTFATSRSRNPKALIRLGSAGSVSLVRTSNIGSRLRRDTAHALADGDHSADGVARRRQGAQPAVVVPAGRVVEEIQIDDQMVGVSTKICTLRRVQRIATAAVALGA